MREVYGDLWAYEGRKGFRICITTNGFLKKDGTGVMGAGVAKQAAEKYPDLPKLLGQSLQSRGNVVSLLTSQIMSFPVKHNWFEDADLALIRESAKELKRRAIERPDIKFVLPRPGCGNGNLSWKIVRNVMYKYFTGVDNIFIITKERDANADKGKAANGSGKA